MITPWEIYWVLQLDSLGNALSGVAFFSFLASLVLVIATIIHKCADPSICEYGKKEAQAMKDRAPKLLRWSVFVAGVFLITFISAVLLPSTKTAAAMIVAPKIINSRTIQHEAGDLYKLAKQALENAVSPEHGPKGGAK